MFILIDKRGSMALSEMLSINLYLKNLNLSSTGINDDTLQIIWEGFKLNRTLESLNLSSNEITSLGVSYICQILSDPDKDQSMKVLNLSHNLINDSGAKLVANMLKINLKLWKIHLNNNEITNKGKFEI